MPWKHTPATKYHAASVRADGASIAQAATAAGVDRTTVWRWESSVDEDYTAGLQHCKRVLVEDAAQLAALAGRELLRRLRDEPEAVSYSELNRIWGTSADKLLAVPEPMADELADLAREDLLEHLAQQLSPADLEAIKGLHGKERPTHGQH